MFHTMEAMSAASVTDSLSVPTVNTSLPSVVATATPNRNGPANSAIAVMVSAWRPERAREAIMVATMFELS